MKKMFVVIIGVTFLMVGISQTVSAAKKNKMECEILASENNKVIMDCGKKAGKLTSGTTVYLRPKSKKKDDLGGGC